MPDATPTPVRSVGLIGGTSPHSTLAIYHELVRLSAERFPLNVYPRIVIVSVNFRTLVDLAQADRWDEIARMFEREFAALHAAGADFAAFTANTPHKALPMLRPALPVLNILDAVADAAKQRGLRALGITGTRFVMNDGFYQAGLEQRGVRSVTPTPDEQSVLDRMIFDELVRGEVRPQTVERYAHIARRLLDNGADALLLGCTEQAMLTAHPDWPGDIPVLDSATVHAEKIWRVCAGLDEAPIETTRSVG